MHLRKLECGQLVHGNYTSVTDESKHGFLASGLWNYNSLYVHVWCICCVY